MSIDIRIGDSRNVLATLADASVHCCITSPPYYGLRDYGTEGQMGLEATPDEFVAGMVAVFREVRRVLREDGTLWLNIADSYAGSRAGPQGASGQMADRSDAAARCREASPTAIDRGKRNAKRWGGGNLPHGDGIKPKDLIGIPWMLAFALRADGWYLRQEIIWHKPNPMPESVGDRCTKSHESVFLLSKSPRYHFAAGAIAEDANCGAKGSSFTEGKTGEHQEGRAQKVRPSVARGGFNGKTEEMAGSGQNAFRAVTETRNKRSVWTIPTQSFREAHFATFPPALVEPCILAGCPVGGTVLDPFFGAGTTGMVADRLQRDCIGIELNPAYAEIARNRISGDAGMFAVIAA